MFNIFMIGRTQATAKPYIMFSCKHRKSREKAVAVIKESRILDQCPPGINVSDWDYPPHLINLQQLASAMTGSDTFIDSVQIDKEIDLYNCRVYPVIDRKSGKARTLQLATRNESAKDGHPRMATIGSVIELEGKRYYVVPSHIFNSTAAEATSEELDTPSEDSECGLDDFDDDDESIPDDQDEAEFMSQYSTSPDPSDTEEDWDLDDGSTISDGESIQGHDERSEQPQSIAMATSNEAITSFDDAELALVGDYAFSITRLSRLSSQSLDYCLIEIEEGENVSKDLPVLSHDSIGHLDRDFVNVTAVTGLGTALKGVISSQRSCIRLPGAAKYINVLSVQFEGSLQPGNCGSIVRDAITDKIYGYLVAGDTESQFAFIVPAADVLDDVMTKLLELEAVSADHKSPPPASQLHFIESVTESNKKSMSIVPRHLSNFIGYSSSSDTSSKGLSLASENSNPFEALLHVPLNVPTSRHATKRPDTEGQGTGAGAKEASKKANFYLEEENNNPDTRIMDSNQETVIGTLTVELHAGNTCEPYADAIVNHAVEVPEDVAPTPQTLHLPCSVWIDDNADEVDESTYKVFLSLNELSLPRGLDDEMQGPDHVWEQKVPPSADLNLPMESPQRNQMFPYFEYSDEVSFDFFMPNPRPLLEHSSATSFFDISLISPLHEPWMEFPDILQPSLIDPGWLTLPNLMCDPEETSRGFPCVDDCFLHTTANVDLTSRTRLGANDQKNARKGVDPLSLASGALDRAKFPQPCPTCRPENINRPAHRAVFKRHVEDKHYPKFEYYCHYDECIDSIRRDKVMDHYRRAKIQEYSSSDYIPYPFYDEDPFSARGIGFSPSFIPDNHLELVSNFIHDALFSKSGARTVCSAQAGSASCCNKQRPSHPHPQFYEWFFEHCITADCYVKHEFNNLISRNPDASAFPSPLRQDSLCFLFTPTFCALDNLIQLAATDQERDNSNQVLFLKKGKNLQVCISRWTDLSAAPQRGDSHYVQLSCNTGESKIFVHVSIMNTHNCSI